MHYELYVDSLFFINFVMNLYLLILVDRSTLRTASPGRLAAGAALGAAGYLFPFLWTAPGVWKLAVGICVGTVGMLCVTFPVKSLRMFLKLLERLILYSFGMGGVLLFLIRSLRPAREILTGTMGILGAGGLAFLLFRRFQFGLKTKDLCTAVLRRGESRVRTVGLVDSGNSLIEPVSGKPVCVAGKQLFERLWGQDTGVYRVIPYHSIGRKRGLLRGYLLPELELEMEGMKLRFKDVYIAVSDEEIFHTDNADVESVEIIINPGLLEKSRKREPWKRQIERRNDSEGNATGQNAIQNDSQG